MKKKHVIQVDLNIRRRKKMQKDVLSSYFAQLLNILIRFFLIPIYLNHLGLSAYGIIAFYFSIESIMVLLDFGIGLAAAKKIAENTLEKNIYTDYSIIRIAEIVYLVIALLIGGIIFFLSTPIATNWLSVDDQNINKTDIIKFMAVLLFVSWPKSFYENLLVGQKRIVAKNIINIIFLTIRSLSLLYVITKVSSTLEAYFLVLIVTFLFEVACLRIISIKRIKSRFKDVSNRELLMFFKGAIKIGFFSILSLALFQIDRIILSKTTTTSVLGMYGLSSILPLSLLSLVYPISSAAFPRLAHINKNEYGKSIFSNWTFIKFSICFGFAVLLSLNYEFIISFWLKKNNLINSTLSFLILFGIVFHVLTLVCTNLFIINDRSDLVNTAYIASIFIYIIAVAIVPAGISMKVAFGWVTANFTLFLAISSFLKRFYSSLFNIYLTNLFKSGLFFGIFFLLFYVLIRFDFLSGLTLLVSSFILIPLSYMLIFKRKITLILKEI
jgi:O-antigen/teichoic acid export membrane protein